MLREIKTNKKFFGLAVLILFSSFAFNVFGTISTDKFIYDFKDSEALVYNQVLCENGLYGDQLLVEKVSYKKSLEKCEPQNLVAYSSQFGLQGKIYDQGEEIFSKVGVSFVSFIALAQLSTALLSAILFASLALWVRRNFGNFVGIFTIFMVSISPMIVGFSRNLYWALPLLIAPLIYILYFYKSTYTRKQMTYFLVGLSFLLYIKYLCGYEYITTITVMSMSVVSYFLYLNKSKLKDYIKNFMLVGAVSIFAFAGALTTHVYSLNSYTGSTKNSIKVIKNTAHERISSSDTYKNYVYDSTQRSLESHYRITDTYFHYENRKQSKSLSIAILVSIVNYALLPVINIPLTLNQPFAIYAQSTFLFIIVLVLLYIKRKSWVKKPEVGKIEALFMAAATGLVGSISWYIAANSHSLVHAHINGILVYLPFALFGYIIIGVWIENSVKKIRRNA